LKEHLREIIESDDVFLNHLTNQHVITNKMKNQLLSSHSVQERNDELINWLLTDNNVDYRKVLKAFEETGQKHVVNYIMADGGISS
jgi:hypothetical protein